MYSAVHITNKIISKTSQTVVTVARRLDDDGWGVVVVGPGVVVVITFG